MAVHVPIMINNERTGRIEIRRTQTGSDGIHTYMWTIWATADNKFYRREARDNAIMDAADELEFADG